MELEMLFYPIKTNLPVVILTNPLTVSNPVSSPKHNPSHMATCFVIEYHYPCQYSYEIIA